MRAARAALVMAAVAGGVLAATVAWEAARRVAASLGVNGQAAQGQCKDNRYPLIHCRSMSFVEVAAGETISPQVLSETPACLQGRPHL